MGFDNWNAKEKDDLNSEKVWKHVQEIVEVRVFNVEKNRPMRVCIYRNGRKHLGSTKTR